MLTSEDETEFHALRKCAAIAILQLVDLMLHYYVSETSRSYKFSRHKIGSTIACYIVTR